MNKLIMFVLIPLLSLSPMTTPAIAYAKPAKEVQASVAAVGDLMALRGQISGARRSGGYNFIPSFAPVASLLKGADLTVGNLETCVAGSGFGYASTQGGLPNLNAPTSYLSALRYCGFDALVTANNHMLDKGHQGIIKTLSNLDRYDFKHTGTFKSAKARNRPLVMTVNGIKIAILGYSQYTNGQDYRIPSSLRGRIYNTYSASRVRRDIQAAKKAGAEASIVYIHWGSENTITPNATQRRVAREIANAGATIIVGSHPHVLQPMTRIKVKSGKTTRYVPVAYSMGNFISSMARDRNHDSAILKFDFVRGASGTVRVANLRYIPTYTMSRFGSASWVAVPCKATAKQHPSIARTLNASYARTVGVMGKGVAKPATK